MHKIIASISLSTTLLFAEAFNVGSSLQSLNDYKFETPQEQSINIPKNTELVIMAFEKDTGALVNDYLDTQDPLYLSQHNTVFIADINKMPGIITALFALPKMKKYKHPIYLHYEEEFQNFIPHLEEKLTLVRIQDGKVKDIFYVSTTEELKTEIQ